MQPVQRPNALSFAIAATALSMSVAPTARATVAFDGSTTYLQNFDTLPSSPVNASGVIWSDDYPAAAAPQDAASLPGWFIRAQSQQSAATGNWQRFRIDTGARSTGSVYSFGTDADRALGILGATTVNTQWIALRLQNTSAQTISSLTLSYDGEQWRAGTIASAQALAFGYKVDAGSIRDSSFNAQPALDFTTLVHTGTATALDGNAPANRTAGITSTLTNLNWEPGQDLWIRWTAPGPSGSHGMAVDNLSISGATFTPGAGSPTWKLDADGTWSAGNTSPWLNGNAPTGTGGLVRLGSQITANRTVTLDTSPTISTLEINTPSKDYTLAANPTHSLNIAAGGSIVVNGVAFDAANLPTNGTLISAPLNFASDAHFRVNDPLAKLTVTGNVTVGAGGGVTLAGPGSVSLPPSFTWSGPTTLDGATVTLSSPSQLGDGSPTNSLILKNGAGLNFAADLAMTRPVNFDASGFTVRTDNVVTLGPVAGPGLFQKILAGTVTVSSLRTDALFIAAANRAETANAGVLRIAPNGTDAATSVIKFLRIESTTASSGALLGQLDVSDNKLIVDYDLANGNNPLGQNGVAGLPAIPNPAGGTLVHSRVAVALWSAFAGGRWTGKGITSGRAQTTGGDEVPVSAYSVGYAEASRLLGLSDSQTTTWGGQTVDATSILIMGTLGGDANLDGTVDADDYALVDRGFALDLLNNNTTPHASANDQGLFSQWQDGDFDYNGIVNAADYLILDRGFLFVQPAAASPAFLADREARFGPDYVAALAASVPEPTSLGLAIAASLPLAARRRRSR
jgi:hypothetical protein